MLEYGKNLEMHGNSITIACLGCGFVSFTWPLCEECRKECLADSLADLPLFLKSATYFDSDHLVAKLSKKDALLLYPNSVEDIEEAYKHDGPIIAHVLIPAMLAARRATMPSGDVMLRVEYTPQVKSKTQVTENALANLLFG